ncbi:hypothetical protein Y032_0316g2283 [Ancylostoma ceylanicum]|uniref:Uncharacterized protein n=1 Tax=Ancylostoma ceylanicum TaxID=53326 RepID=A0A016S2G6_9BILA|nr:hypothetical protein Y032_0316g2283 [Ancylostoma ceylanicum]
MLFSELERPTIFVSVLECDEEFHWYDGFPLYRRPSLNEGSCRNDYSLFLVLSNNTMTPYLLQAPPRRITTLPTLQPKCHIDELWSCPLLWYIFVGVQVLIVRNLVTPVIRCDKTPNLS